MGQGCVRDVVIKPAVFRRHSEFFASGKVFFTYVKFCVFGAIIHLMGRPFTAEYLGKHESNDDTFDITITIQ